MSIVLDHRCTSTFSIVDPNDHFLFSEYCTIAMSGRTKIFAYIGITLIPSIKIQREKLERIKPNIPTRKNFIRFSWDFLLALKVYLEFK